MSKPEDDEVDKTEQTNEPKEAPLVYGVGATPGWEPHGSQNWVF